MSVTEDKFSEQLEVGDIVVVTSALSSCEYEITRVTKTLALSRRESDGYEHRFYRDVKKGVAYHKSPPGVLTYNIIKRGDA